MWMPGSPNIARTNPAVPFQLSRDLSTDAELFLIYSLKLTVSTIQGLEPSSLHQPKPKMTRERKKYTAEFQEAIFLFRKPKVVSEACLRPGPVK